MNTDERIPVGVSSCLLGNEVRYNGSHKRDAFLTGTLTNFFDLRPLCPEVGIGMGVPRPAIRLVATPEGVRARGVKDATMDVTDKLRDFSARQEPFLSGLYGFILKKSSPSCGMERVKLFNDKGMPENKGTGIFARELMARFPLLPVEEEGRLGDPGLRENFIQRVFIYHYWHTQVMPDLSVDALTRCHARLKLTLMSHHQDEARALGRLAATASSENVAIVAGDYIQGAMKTLKRIATPKNHVNVLQHIQGYLKNHLDRDDKAELGEVIGKYYDGMVPLIVPLILLQHHFRRHPDPYIQGSWYLSPYPAELKLRNLI